MSKYCLIYYEMKLYIDYSRVLSVIIVLVFDSSSFGDADLSVSLAVFFLSLDIVVIYIVEAIRLMAVLWARQILNIKKNNEFLCDCSDCHFFEKNVIVICNIDNDNDTYGLYMNRLVL